MSSYAIDGVVNEAGLTLRACVVAKNKTEPFSVHSLILLACLAWMSFGAGVVIVVELVVVVIVVVVIAV